MALVSGGKISMGDINQEFGYSRTTPISLNIRDLFGSKQLFINNSWVNLNPCSTFQPNAIVPHSISEWYRYDHNELCPTTTTSTTTTTLPPCIAITDFSYTINGNVDWNGFVLEGGTQDINISVNSYTPSSGYTTPVQYEYILDSTSTGVIDGSTKSYPSLTPGFYSLVIRVYNCGILRVEKFIGFSIEAVTTTTTTTSTTSTTTTTTSTTSTTTTTTLSPCIPITDYNIVGATIIEYPNPININITGENGDIGYQYSYGLYLNGRGYFQNYNGLIYDNLSCNDIGYSVTLETTVSNCSGTVTKITNITILAPTLPTPSISACKFQEDGTYKARITVTNHNPNSVLKLYYIAEDNEQIYVTTINGTTINVLLTPYAIRYYVISELCSYSSYSSNIEYVGLISTPDC